MYVHEHNLPKMMPEKTLMPVPEHFLLRELSIVIYSESYHSAS